MNDHSISNEVDYHNCTARGIANPATHGGRSDIKSALKPFKLRLLSTKIAVMIKVWSHNVSLTHKVVTPAKM